MSERTLLLGFDLGEEKSQMAVYDREKNIPVLIGQNGRKSGRADSDRDCTFGRKAFAGFSCADSQTGRCGC